MTILVTGGAGYIGSHTLVELLGTGQQVVVLDNLSNSSPESLKRVERITGKPVTFVKGDILDRACLERLFAEYRIESVIHFAGLKAVGESAQIPLTYYQNNVTGTLVLCEEMAKAGVFRLVFSSSATVYGDPASVPLREDFPTGATNPYGRSKLMVEEILRDLAKSDPRWAIVLLRYFNQVGVGKLKELGVFGNDYPTPDGTGVRDYIHVVDLAIGHLKALARIEGDTGVFTYNLGTGQGYSVLEMVKAFETASGRPIPYQIKPRRPGDIAECWAEPTLARDELGWQAERGLEQMMVDTWRWQSHNPNGYQA